MTTDNEKLALLSKLTGLEAISGAFLTQLNKQMKPIAEMLTNPDLVTDFVENGDDVKNMDIIITSYQELVERVETIRTSALGLIESKQNLIDNDQYKADAIERRIQAGYYEA